ncbi:MAG: 3'-5' exonuclease [Fuerstiella sp.]
MKFFLVIDLEATCCDDQLFARTEMEIIEIGAVMVDCESQQPVDEFQAFVRPVLHGDLTSFCKQLTGIAQHHVDGAELFPDVLNDLMAWTTQYPDSTFCSWGDYDRVQFQRDCERHSVTYPFADQHINLKKQFASVSTGHGNMGVLAALESVELSFVGEHHRGIDDARNISRLIPFIF